MEFDCSCYINLGLCLHLWDQCKVIKSHFYTLNAWMSRLFLRTQNVHYTFDCIFIFMTHIIIWSLFKILLEAFSLNSKYALRNHRCSKAHIFKEILSADFSSSYFRLLEKELSSQLKLALLSFAKQKQKLFSRLRAFQKYFTCTWQHAKLP